MKPVAAVPPRIDPYVAEWFGAGEIPDIHGLAKELGALARFAIWRWGSEEQKLEWLSRMATG